MTTPTVSEGQGSSTRPYLIRALHDWCTDNGFTPYLAVYVDGAVQVPMEYVKNNEIVLNTSFEATSSLQLGNDAISFKARFGGVAREIMVPIDHVIAIYARENGQGMAFPAPNQTPPLSAGPTAVSEAPARGLRLASVPDPTDAEQARPADPAASEHDDQPTPPEPGGSRPSLKRVK
jgi:stringent starvation protein B